jgi:hypothetical protein
MPRDMTIYEDMRAAGLEIHNHCSDLYVEINDTSREILDKPEHELHKRNATGFMCQVTHKMHFDIPFAYEPYWESRR